MVWESCLDILRNEMIIPAVIRSVPVRLIFVTCLNTRIPPITAINTYIRFPIFPSAGIRMLPMVFAFSLSLKSCSLSSLKPSLLSSSWQNTLMTFCPLIISSMYPSSFASAFCCFIIYTALCPPSFFVTLLMMKMKIPTIIVSHTL